jgi:hypothetical protein
VPRPRESDLYPAVKAFLQGQGYTVKGEVRGCDVVGVRGDEPPVVVELKLAFSLGLVLQGVDRLAMTDRVYLAVPRPRGRRGPGAAIRRRDVRALCRRLGLGLLAVGPAPDAAAVEVVLDPLPYRPRPQARRLGRLLGEHARREGDPNPGGLTRTPLVTAYRQEALRCALLIDRAGRAPLRALRESGLVPNAPRILQRDVYGWFQRVARATYRLTDRARADLARFTGAGALPVLPPPPEPAPVGPRATPGPPACGDLSTGRGPADGPDVAGAPAAGARPRRRRRSAAPPVEPRVPARA